jgi:hypothetical protein
MTYSDDYTIPEEVLEQICEEVFAALSDLVRIMINAAMRVERQKHLRAGPYERTPERQGYSTRQLVWARSPLIFPRCVRATSIPVLWRKASLALSFWGKN